MTKNIFFTIFSFFFFSTQYASENFRALQKLDSEVEAIEKDSCRTLPTTTREHQKQQLASIEHRLQQLQQLSKNDLYSKKLLQAKIGEAYFTIYGIRNLD